MTDIELLKKKRWSYLIIGMILLLFLGLIYAWSVFRAPLEQEFGWTKSQTSVTFSISIMMYCLGGFAGGMITGKKGHRVTLALCAACLLAGFVLSSRVETLAGIYVSYGVFCGFGVGLGYNAAISTLVRWFPDRQGFISGTALMGYGFGAMVLGTAGAKMIQMMGWRQTFVIFAIAFAAIVLLCSALMRPAPQSFVDAMVTEGGKASPSVEELEPAQMLRRRNFWIYFMWAIVMSAAGLAILNHVAPFAQSVLGCSLTKAAAVAGIVSIFNGIGRVIAGLVYDRTGYRPTMLTADGLFVIAGALLILSLSTGSYAVLVTAFAVTGTAYGFVPPTNSAFAAYFFGRKNYPVNFSLVNLNLLIASYLGPLCGGGSYMRTFAFIIAFAVIAFVLTCMIKRPERAGKERD